MAEGAVQQAIRDVVAGSVGGILAALVGHPFDTIKVRLQAQPTSPPVYAGFGDCVRQTWKIEGLTGFYRGLSSPLGGMLVFNAVQFMAYGQACDWISSRKSTQLDLTDYMACGALTGVAVSVVETPMDLGALPLGRTHTLTSVGTVKSQVQVQVFRARIHPGSLYFTSALDAAAQIWRLSGIRGIYQGLGATLLRNIPAVSLYFGAYEQMRLAIAARGVRNVTELSSVELLCSGGVAGLCYWLFTYPADIIKSTMQTDDVFRNQRRYRSVVDCVIRLYRDGGVPRFFRGLTPCMLRAFPANAACFWGVEQTRRMLQ